MSRIPTAWTKRCKSEKEKNDLEQLLQHSTLLLRQLRCILEEKYEEKERSATRLTDFEDPAWSHKQAWRNGYVAALLELKELTEFVETMTHVRTPTVSTGTGNSD